MRGRKNASWFSPAGGVGGCLAPLLLCVPLCQSLQEASGEDGLYLYIEFGTSAGIYRWSLFCINFKRCVFFFSFIKMHFMLVKLRVKIMSSKSELLKPSNCVSLLLMAVLEYSAF